MSILKTFHCPTHGDQDRWVTEGKNPTQCEKTECMRPITWVPTGCNLGGDMQWFGHRKCGYDDMQLGYVRDRAHYQELTKDCETVTKPKYETGPSPEQINANLRKRNEKALTELRRKGVFST